MAKNEALGRWQAEAEALPAQDYKPKLPIFVLIGEAHDLSAQMKRHWRTKRDRKGRILERGLDLVGAERLPERAIIELVSLAEGLQQAQSRYVLTTGPASREGLTEEAEALVSEVSAALDFLFDDGVVDEKDEQLANVHQEHDADPSTPDALASELDDYAALAHSHRKELDGLGGFDVDDIERATKVAAQLRELPSDAAATAERAASRQALDLRNRVAYLLQQRSSQARNAARFVFRDHPETARKFTSTYERRKRAAARRAKQKEASQEGASPRPVKPEEPTRLARVIIDHKRSVDDRSLKNLRHFL